MLTKFGDDRSSGGSANLVTDRHIALYIFTSRGARHCSGYYKTRRNSDSRHEADRTLEAALALEADLAPGSDPFTSFETG